MKLFVTGASGYIGGSVASKLHDAGHEVLGLVRSEEKVVHWPGVTHPGSVCDLPVTGTDMMRRRRATESTSWPWYLAGPLIGLFVPALLISGNKLFGISTRSTPFKLRHLNSRNESRPCRRR
jgi:hypothetical protein